MSQGKSICPSIHPGVQSPSHTFPVHLHTDVGRLHPKHSLLHIKSMGRVSRPHPAAANQVATCFALCLCVTDPQSSPQGGPSPPRSSRKMRMGQIPMNASCVNATHPSRRRAVESEQQLLRPAEPPPFGPAGLPSRRGFWGWEADLRKTGAATFGSSALAN